MIYRQCGKSGLRLPVFSLGLWHNFGANDDFGEATRMVLAAFEAGAVHFDLGNNYGPPPGSAETTFGRIFRHELAAHRDELFVSSKAGHDMWAGPFGTGSSRKNILASCDQSLRRTGLDYFDVFYSHRYDGVTPVEETMEALVSLVRQGKALYVGISKYPPAQQRQAYDYLRSRHVPCLLSQYRHSLFDRKAQLGGSFALAAEEGSGIICFSPLAQGLLTGKYSHGIPSDSRAAKASGFLQVSQVTPERVAVAKKLDEIARRRGQTLAQMALAWALSDERVTSVILGASSVRQLQSNLQTLEKCAISPDEMAEIDALVADPALSF